MISCYKPIFNQPARRFVNVIFARECQIFSPSLSQSIRSCVSCKLKSSPTLDKLPFFRQLLSTTPYLSNRLRDTFLDQNGTKYSGKYQLRYYSNEVNEKKEPDKKEIEREEPEKKLNMFQKFKQMYKEYWYVLVPVHIITSSIWFGSFYYLAKSGVDIVAVLQWLDIGETLVEKLQKGKGTIGYLAVASAMYKIATPARYAVTLGGTTISIKYLKDWGYIKPIPPKEKIKELIDEKKNILRRKREEKCRKDTIEEPDKS